MMMMIQGISKNEIKRVPLYVLFFGDDDVTSYIVKVGSFTLVNIGLCQIILVEM